MPLDHAGAAPGTLGLKVALAGPPDGPVLINLTGGPGQQARYSVPATRKRLRGAGAAGWRIVGAIDQRGTGAGALRCPALQREMGASDLTTPTPGAVRAARRADRARAALLRQPDRHGGRPRAAAPGATASTRIALDGTSYGTYVAERYALAHPDRVDRLVLDWVIPRPATG